MPTTEAEMNTALAEVLDGMRRRWTAFGEPTRGFTGSARRPDVLVVEQGVAPVVVETEFLPADTVEQDARSRLGERLSADGAEVLAVVAARVPARFRQVSQAKLRAEIRIARDLEYALFTGETDENARRFPPSGWLTGGMGAFANIIHKAAVPESAVEAAVSHLESGVSTAANILSEAVEFRPDTGAYISEALKQEDGLQTRRMAMAIVANAFVFQENLAGSFGIRGAARLRNDANNLIPSDVADEWKKILDINYWPIFDIAREIVISIPTSWAVRILDRLSRTALDLIAEGVTRSHDLSGTVFQRLVADRKFLATFYTRPSAASLLATLSIPELEDWGDAERVREFAIADFACGTGTLLSSAYQRIGQMHEQAGGDSETLHPHMMEHALIGMDVMPSAVHLTASMIASAHPESTFEGTRLYTLPYGRQPAHDYALGSLDLLSEDHEIQPLFRTSAPVRVEGGGSQEVRQILELPPESCDLVIMNPPFTRPTNHGGVRANVPNPAFAAFGTSKDDQDAMAKIAKELGKATCANGNAGIASHFTALADKMVKQEGTVALVLPMVALQGMSWRKMRSMFAQRYQDVTVVTIAGAKSYDKSFSADTGIGELLLVARKRQSETLHNRGLFVSLRQRPRNTIEASEIGEAVRKVVAQGPRRIEDGPYGGSPLFFGDEQVGEVLDCPLPAGGQWGVAGILDLSIAQTAYALACGRFELAAELPSMSIPISRLGDIASMGFLARDINEGAGRGAFDIHPPYHPVPDIPSLWNHDARRERAMIVEPDGEASIRIGKETRAKQILNARSHAHHNAEFRFNSQSTAVAYTERITLGGRAWPNVVFKNPAHEIAFTLWGNSTLGGLCYWWHSSKQDSGRGAISFTSANDLPTLDVRALEEAQLDAARGVFDALKGEPMRPFNEAVGDPIREELDRGLLVDVLGFDASIMDALEMLRRKLCAEPSIHGGKKSREGV